MTRRSATAAAVLAVHAITLLLAFPGLDRDAGALQTDAERREVEAQVGRFWMRVGFALAEGNRRFRAPVVAWFAPVEAVFRIKQNWTLYTDGPDTVTRLEIRVDDVPVYRSADPTLRWRAPQLSYRRMRPMVAGLTLGSRGPHLQALGSWIVGEVVGDWPQATRVDLVTLDGPFPGDALTEKHRLTWTSASGRLVRKVPGRSP